jgi:hypothetical protein
MFGFPFRFFQQGCSGELALATLGHFVQLSLHPTILTCCFFLFFVFLPELVILEVAIYGIHPMVNLVQFYNGAGCSSVSMARISINPDLSDGIPG